MKILDAVRTNIEPVNSFQMILQRSQGWVPSLAAPGSWTCFAISRWDGSVSLSVLGLRDVVSPGGSQ